MNIHPLFVHFPIALLVIYALMELTPKKWTGNALWWRNSKMFLIITGWLTTIPTLITGDMAEDIVGATTLIETHATMAAITVTIFAIPAIAYTIKILKTLPWYKNILLKDAPYVSILKKIQTTFEFILRPVLIRSIALIGMISLTITGGLGASIAYGPDFDPIVSFIYGIFF